LVIALAGLLLAAIASHWSTFVAAIIAIVAVGGPSTASIVARLIDPKVLRLNSTGDRRT
jgi:hypothetical protein